MITKQFIKVVTLILSLSTVTVMAEISVIVNPANTATVSADEVKRIFLGKSKKFSDGASAVPINLKPSSDVRGTFDDSALGKTTNQTKAYWSKLVFSGKGNPPKEADTEAEVIELVSKNPSLIGYIDSSKVTADVKVVVTF